MFVAAVTRTADEVFLLVFGGIAVIVVTARVVGRLFSRIGLPAVVGEVVGGVFLGPSVLGLLPGDPSALLFPPDIQPFLRIIASFGLVIYMFIVGLELDPRTVQAERRAAISISLSSIVLPFALGALAGLVVYSSHDTATREVGGVPIAVDVDQLAFVLFCGLAICGSAFAILARILDERRLFRTRIGGVLLASTVVDDIVVWMLASVVLAIAAAGGLAEVPLVLGGLIVFVVALFALVRPALRRLMSERFRRDGGLSSDVFAIILVGLLLSALYTTWLGISPILGAFFFGAAVPRDGTTTLFAQMNERLESVSVLVLLPVFFAVTGLGVDLSSIGLDGLRLLVLFVVLATIGKMLGAAFGASLNGIRGRRAFGVGVLMNTRGLSELALISIGRALGVLDTTMFTVLVCTAIVTTLISGPLLGLVYPQRFIDDDIASAERVRLAETSVYRVLVVIDDDTLVDAMVEVAISLGRSEADAEVVLGRIASSGPTTELGSGLMGDLARATVTLDEVRQLSQRVAAADVVAVPQSRITDDLEGEVMAQIDMVRPHLVLLDIGTARAHPGLLDRIDRIGCVDAAVVEGPVPGPGVVTTSGSPREPHRTLAADVALRLALGRRAALATADRAIAEAATTLRGPGGSESTGTSDATAIDVRWTDEGGGASQTDDGRTIVSVRAHESATARRRLDDVVSRLRGDATPAND